MSGVCQLSINVDNSDDNFQLCAENQLRVIEGACCLSTSTEEVRDGCTASDSRQMDGRRFFC